MHFNNVVSNRYIPKAVETHQYLEIPKTDIINLNIIYTAVIYQVDSKEINLTKDMELITVTLDRIP